MSGLFVAINTCNRNDNFGNLPTADSINFYLDVAARVKAVQLVDQLQHGSLNLSEKLDQDVLWFKLRWFQHSFKLVD